MMNNPTATTAILAVALAIAAITLVGCADQLAVDCHYDADCPNDKYCIDAQCRSGCSDDRDCDSSSYCGPYQREDQAGPVQICMSPDQSDTGCSSDQQCRDQYDDPRARCGIHDRCVLEPGQQSDDDADDDGDANATPDNSANNDTETTEQPWILVVEQLDIDGLPVDGDLDDDQTVPPLRIGAVVVRDDQESLIGHGQLLAVTQPDGTDTTDESGLTYPLAQQGQCVEDPASADHASLGGPGGRASIQLVEDVDDSDFTDDAATVDIIADGPECPIGSSNDDREDFGQYRAMLCREATSDPDLQDCQEEYPGPHGAHTRLDVAFSD